MRADESEVADISVRQAVGEVGPMGSGVEALRRRHGPSRPKPGWRCANRFRSRSLEIRKSSRAVRPIGSAVIGTENPAARTVVEVTQMREQIEGAHQEVAHIGAGAGRVRAVRAVQAAPFQFVWKTRPSLDPDVNVISVRDADGARTGGGRKGDAGSKESRCFSRRTGLLPRWRRWCR